MCARTGPKLDSGLDSVLCGVNLGMSLSFSGPYLPHFLTEAASQNYLGSQKKPRCPGPTLRESSRSAIGLRQIFLNAPQVTLQYSSVDNQ